jgi:hypothetical protein
VTELAPELALDVVDVVDAGPVDNDSTAALIFLDPLLVAAALAAIAFEPNISLS